MNIDEVAAQLCICHGSAHEIIHNNLGFHKVCAPSKSAYRRTTSFGNLSEPSKCDHDKVVPS
jgi:hypothetical protein